MKYCTFHTHQKRTTCFLPSHARKPHKSMLVPQVPPVQNPSLGSKTLNAVRQTRVHLVKEIVLAGYGRLGQVDQPSWDWNQMCSEQCGKCMNMVVSFALCINKISRLGSKEIQCQGSQGMTIIFPNLKG